MTHPAHQPRRILAIKLADMGDLLLITPALHALRAAYPEATLDLLTTPQSASPLESSSLVDKVHLFDKLQFDSPKQLLNTKEWGQLLGLVTRLRGRRYDTVILFHHLTLQFGALKHAALCLATGAPRRIGLDNGRGWFLTHRIADPGFGTRHELDLWLDLVAAVGAPAVSRQLVLELADLDRAQAASLLGETRRPLVALHPGSGGYSLARRWELEKFVDLGRRLSELAQVVVIGTLADGTAELAAALGEIAVDLGGRTTLQELAAVLAQCDLLIGADSGVLHIGAAVGVPTVALFGPTNHHAWAPNLPPNQLTVIRAGSACSPCAYIGHQLGTPQGCPQRTCMAMIQVEQVAQAALTALQRSAPSHRTPAVSDPPAHQPPAAVGILGIPVHAITFDNLLTRIGQLIKDQRPHQITTVNPEFIMKARRDSTFQAILRRATLCLPDGVGLLWASRWLSRGRRGGPLLPERVTGSDGVPLIAELAAERGWRLFLLGAAPGVAERTAAILSERHPDLQIVGTSAGNPTAQEEAGIVEQINASEADILFVAYGAPKQDKWIARNLPRLQVGVAMGVGGAFDFISGEAVRAPGWMRRMGLEWFHRLLHQPWRWRRMLALPRFALAVFWDGLQGRGE